MADNRLHSKQAWQSAMGPSAQALEHALWDLVSDYGTCLICQKPFGSMASHLNGNAHYRSLGYKVNWSWPQNSDNLVQRWICRDGRAYSFNHLTGIHSPDAGQPAPRSASPSEFPMAEGVAQRTTTLEAAPSVPAAVPVSPRPQPEVVVEAKEGQSNGDEQPAPRAASPSEFQQAEDTAEPVTALEAAPLPPPSPPPSAPAAAPLSPRPQPEVVVEAKEEQRNGDEQPAPQVASMLELAEDIVQLVRALEAPPPPPSRPPPLAPAASPLSPRPQAEVVAESGEEHINGGDGWSKVEKEQAQQPQGGPSQPQSGGRETTAPTCDQYGLVCTACRRKLAYHSFHRKQQKYSLENRRCIECIERASAEESMATCTVCQECLDASKFRKNTNWGRPVCKACLEQKELDERMVLCSGCSERLDVSRFRKGTAWGGNPTCRSCSEQAEKVQYLEWRKQQQAKAAQEPEGGLSQPQGGAGEATAPSGDQEDGLVCTACRRKLAYSSFHKRQQKCIVESRRCIECIDRACAEECMATCTVCQERLDASKFRKNTDWTRPVCKDCLEQKQLDERMVLCSACGERQDVSKFRKGTAWDCNPMCRSCCEQAEEEQYLEWQKQQRVEAEERERRRGAMNESMLQGHYDKEIKNRVCGGCVLRRHADARFSMLSTGVEPRAREVWGKVVGWAQILAELVQSNEDEGRLNKAWRHETPSRAHASDRVAAEQFKAWEDKGDALVQESAGTFYMTFVAGQHVEQMQLRYLLAEVALMAGERSWELPSRSLVVMALRPVEGWCSGVCAAERFRPEPRSGAEHTSEEMFVQFDKIAFDALCRAHPVLPEDCPVEVKLATSAMWQAVEADLYGDRIGVGSHHHIFDRLFKNARGAAQAANWTEVMNIFADLVGFADEDAWKPGKSLGRVIWAEHFGHLFPVRLQVSYGAGGEFKADKDWQRKMEANVAEALIGALAAAGLQDLADAACALCMLCSMVWPDGILPSNWAMAEKVLAMEQARKHGGRTVGDELALRHLNWPLLCARMASWLDRFPTRV